MGLLSSCFCAKQDMAFAQMLGPNLFSHGFLRSILRSEPGDEFCTGLKLDVPAVDGNAFVLCTAEKLRWGINLCSMSYNKLGTRPPVG